MTLMTGILLEASEGLVHAVSYSQSHWVTDQSRW